MSTDSETPTDEDDPDARRPDGDTDGQESADADGQEPGGADGRGPDEETVEALHEVELGCEWLQRANGHLLQFHHATGHGMDHLAAAEERLRAAGEPGLADAIRDELLPRGVVDDDRWSYDLVESFQHGLLTDVGEFEQLVREELVAGDRHVAERRQERRWKDRSEK